MLQLNPVGKCKIGPQLVETQLVYSHVGKNIFEQSERKMPSILLFAEGVITTLISNVFCCLLIKLWKNILSFCLFVVLRVEPRALGMLSKYFTVHLYSILFWLFILTYKGIFFFFFLSQKGHQTLYFLTVKLMWHPNVKECTEQNIMEYQTIFENYFYHF